MASFIYGLLVDPYNMCYNEPLRKKIYMKKQWNIFLAIFFAGIVSLILELSVLREFSYVFGATAFSNSVIISTFLAGLVLGTYLGAWKKFKSKDCTASSVKFALIQLLMIVFIAGFYITKRYFIYICPHIQLILPYFIVSTGVPSLLSGLSYAAAVEILYHKGEKYIIYIYAVSTLGSVLGGMLHGIFLVPFFGMKSTYILAIIFAALAFSFIFPFTRLRLKALIFLITLFSVFIIHSDIFTLYHNINGLLASKDSPYGPVETWQVAGNGISLRVNNVHQYYTYDWDTRVHKEWASTTLEIINRPCNVLVFGYGSGVSSAAFLESPLPKRVDTIENCLAVVELSKTVFPNEYQIVAYDPRANLIIQDFRHYIRFTKIKYDIIVLDHGLIDPLYCGLFTTDFFNQIRKILTPNGIVAISGVGVSAYTTSLAFNYFYQNINPEIEPYIRSNVYFLALERMDKNTARNYKETLKNQIPEGPVYSDDSVDGMTLPEMIQKIKHRAIPFTQKF